MNSNWHEAPPPKPKEPRVKGEVSPMQAVFALAFLVIVCFWIPLGFLIWFFSSR